VGPKRYRNRPLASPVILLFPCDPSKAMNAPASIVTSYPVQGTPPASSKAMNAPASIVTSYPVQGTPPASKHKLGFAKKKKGKHDRSVSPELLPENYRPHNFTCKGSVPFRPPSRLQTVPTVPVGNPILLSSTYLSTLAPRFVSFRFVSLY